VSDIYKGIGEQEAPAVVTMCSNQHRVGRVAHLRWIGRVWLVVRFLLGFINEKLDIVGAQKLTKGDEG